MSRNKMNNEARAPIAIAERAAGTLPALFLFLLLCLATMPAAAQKADHVPDELEGIGITEHLNATIPLDLPFADENGKPVTLRDYFKGDKPVILDLGYYRCPMLCGLVLNGLTDAMKPLDWTAGEKFTVIAVSVDPLETPTLAKLKKQTYMKEYARPDGVSGWHFLTGPESSITALTEAVGFGFKWNEKRQEFAHAAVLTILTPEGKVSRYLYGVQFETKDLRLSLLEASQGKIGSTMDRIILFCHRYDPTAGTYTLAAMNIMRVGATLTLLVFGIALFLLWRRDLRRKHHGAPGDPEALVEAGSKTP